MKKFAAIVLALALCMSLGVCAMAADKTESQDVTVDVQGVTTADPVYSTAITWGTWTFTYNFDGGKVTWDPDTFTYSIKGSGANAGWLQANGSYAESVTKSITVTNRSNDEIGVTIAISNVDGEKGVEIAQSATSFVVDSADNANYDKDNPPTNSANITVSGVPETENGFTLGKVTVSITHGTN